MKSTYSISQDVHSLPGSRMSGYLQYCRLVAVDSLSIEWGVEYHREHIQVRLSVTSTFVVADTVLTRLK